MANVRLDTPALDDLESLIDKVDELRGLDPVARAIRCRDLQLQIGAALTRAREEAVTHAKLLPIVGEHGPQKLRTNELARQLGITRASVWNLVSAYSAWRRHCDDSP